MRRRRSVDLVVFDVYRDGHRRDYFRVLRRVLGGFAVWGSVRERWPVLLAARQLVCATVDDYLPAFAALALLRALRGRTTVALSIRSETIFSRSDGVGAAKRLFLRALRLIPGVRFITFMPYWVEPRLAHYSHDWMYDLQYWDVPWLSPASSTALSGLADELRRAARGRAIVVSIGHQRQVKGVEYFASLYERSELRERFLFVCLGPRWDVSPAVVQRFQAAGGLFIDRALRDDEMLPIYGLADIVWACYRPDYNQSSGIFGRAIQFGRPSIVRQGSYLATLQTGLGAPGCAIAYNSPEQASAALLDLLVEPLVHAEARTEPERGWPFLPRLLGRPLRAPGRACGA